MLDKPFLSVAQTADVLGVSVRTVYRMISDGSLPVARARGRLIIPASALDALVGTAIR
jgi:excisionase family DNA binding protein